MKIYIASSWKNQHAVEMLTDLLRNKGHEIFSFVEKAVADEGRTNIKFDFEQWIYSEDGMDKFIYDTKRATTSDMVIYIGPSGTDAWAEVGAAWGCGVRILGLWAKGEPAGLMRHMVEWHTNFRDLLNKIPIEIEDRSECCPACGSIMSFGYDRYFCRGCGYSARQPCGARD